ncbi:hypothetical protein MKX03_031786 [Papaver bracteatum]|nr:hypothetical protein MKX03_031786 [Papaver bracteatum]
MDSVLQLKVQRYEDFVDSRLKPDLMRAIAERFAAILTYKNAVMSLRTLVNLGSEVYMQADVHIFVDVGLGFHVEFTWPEALEFISLKEARLAKFVKAFRSCSSFQQHDPFFSSDKGKLTCRSPVHSLPSSKTLVRD